MRPLYWIKVDGLRTDEIQWDTIFMSAVHFDIKCCISLNEVYRVTVLNKESLMIIKNVLLEEKDRLHDIYILPIDSEHYMFNSFSQNTWELELIQKLLLLVNEGKLIELEQYT